MRLRDLNARFLKWSGHGSFIYTDLLEGADGIWFLCPKCFLDNAGAIGTHAIICWFRGRVPDSESPGPGRWNPSGTGYDNLTFVPPGVVSVKLTAGCGWHGHVSNGDAA
jgi:hypothetical protein